MPLPAEKLPSRCRHAWNDEQSARWPREGTMQPKSRTLICRACADARSPGLMQSGKCKTVSRVAPEKPEPAAFLLEKVGRKAAVLPNPADWAQVKSPRASLQRLAAGETAQKSNRSIVST